MDSTHVRDQDVRQPPGEAALPQQGDALRLMLVGLVNGADRICPDCGCTIRDRRPGPVKQVRGVCVDRLCVDGTRENWVALLCVGCGVKRYGFPAKTLEEVYWPAHWTEETNAR